MIYSPHRRQRRQAERPVAREDRLLQCVLPLSDPAEPRVARWLAAMDRGHRLKECRKVTVDMTVSPAHPRTEDYFIFEFVPVQLGLHQTGGRAAFR
jgi:hypothetical protein